VENPFDEVSNWPKVKQSTINENDKSIPIYRLATPSEVLNTIADHDLTKEISLDEVSSSLDVIIKQDNTSKNILFLTSLLTYTENDQVNIALKGESASGKSWIAQRIVDLHPEASKETLSYASPTAFFHEKGIQDPETGLRLIDYERKLVLFLDMPNPQLLERLRPTLSHDKKIAEILITDHNEKSGFRARKVLLKGYFTTIFCSADSIYDEQEQTRMLFLSPSDDPSKIADAIRLTAECQKDPDTFAKHVRENEGLQTLRKRIIAIERAKIRNIKIPKAGSIAENFLKAKKHLAPRHMRDFPRLLYLIKAHAVLNFANRTFNDKDITVNDNDIDAGMKLYEQIANSNELGLDPATHDFLTSVLQPQLTQMVQATQAEISQAYYQTKHRTIGYGKMKRILRQLQTIGVIEEVTDSRDRRQKAYKAITVK
jgi:ABC-type dipeptide/oligopeptide/nickel transport system ATPase component